MEKVIIEDGACDGKTSINAANKLINVDKIKYIIGGQCSAETIAIAPLAEQNKVILLSPLSSNPSISFMGDYIFRNYPSDSYQGKVAAQYVKNKLGINKVAILASLNDWSTGLKNEFKNDFEALGGKVILIEEYKKDTLDLRSELAAIKDSNAELIYMPDYTASTISAIKQEKELGMNTPLFGGDAWMDTTIWNEAGNIAKGTMFTSTKDNTSPEFKEKFDESYPESEIVLGATNNYDAIYILSNAIKSSGDNTEKVKDYLYNMPEYKGISGIIAFDENGDLRNPAYEIKYIHNGKIETLETV
ncbi:MAG: ABC transporter substrate-binding protein [Candidatus Diapherotrites archaeon]|nr:ABC transporter substrate-binding protein [Candidatus Diapherotrites archaeon]